MTAPRFRPGQVVRRTLALVAVLVALCPAPARAAGPLPTLTQPVNDFAGVIDADSAAKIDRFSRTLERATGDAVVVVTIKTFSPDYADIREFAVKQFENNGRGIGDKAKDNGVLVVLAVDDRKVWIEVGYGLEGAITDGFAGETSRLYMAPAFKQGQFGAGLLAGVSRLIARIAQERNVSIDDLPKLAGQRRAPDADGGVPLGFILTVVVILLIIHWLQPRNRRRGGMWRSGPTSFGGSSWSGWGGGGSFGGGSFGGGGGFGGFGGGGSGGGGGGSSW